MRQLCLPLVFSVFVAAPACKEPKTQTPPQPTASVASAGPGASGAPTGEPMPAPSAPASASAGLPKGTYFLLPQGDCSFVAKLECPKEAHIECDPVAAKQMPCPDGVPIELMRLQAAPERGGKIEPGPFGACKYVPDPCPPTKTCLSEMLVRCPPK